jgi:hypothetical protein
VVEATADTVRKFLEPGDDSTEGCALDNLPFSQGHVLAGLFDERTQPFCAPLKIGELDGAGFIGVDQPFQAGLVTSSDAGRIVKTLLQLCRSTVAITP